MDRKGHGGKAWTPSKKGHHGSERNESEKSEGFRSAGLLEDGSEGFMKTGIVAKDRHGSREGVRVSQFETEGSEKFEGGRVYVDNEGLQRAEGLRVLASKALDCEREERGKAHSHSVQVSPCPSSKSSKYDRGETQFSKGIRSELDASRKEDGLKMKDADQHQRSKMVCEQSSSEESSFDTARKNDVDVVNGLVGGGTVTKDHNLSDVKEEMDDKTARSVHRSRSLSSDEGSRKLKDAFEDETEKDDDYRNSKVCSASDRSEMEEGELSPQEGDDAQNIAKADAVEELQKPAEAQIAAFIEGKEEVVSTEDEEIILPEENKDTVENETGNGKNSFANESEAKDEAKQGMEFPAEAECKDRENIERCRSWIGSEKNFEGYGQKDVVKPMEVDLVEKAPDTSCRDYPPSFLNVNGCPVLVDTETEAAAKTLCEYVAVGHFNNVAGPSRNLGCQEPAVEEEDGHYLKKLRMERLEPPTLSLSLPDTSLSLGSHGVPRVAKAPSKTKSMRSLSPSEAHSNGVTTSLSLSYSQPFMHNPSCSLTQTSLDNQEFSSASQQVSQCNDQLSHGSLQISHGSDRAGSHRFMDVSSERWKPHRELSLYQQLLQNGNSPMYQGSLGVERGREAYSQSEQKGLKRPLGQDRTGLHQISHLSKHLPPLSQQYKRISDGSQGRSIEDVGFAFERRKGLDLQEPCHTWSSPATSVGSWEKWVEQRNIGKSRTFAEREATKLENGLSGKFSSFERNEDLSATLNSVDGGKVDLFEIVTNPIPIMAQKLSKLPESYVDVLKESLKDMLVNSERREEFGQLQKLLQTRTDLSSETLQRAHRTQLELLVAMKTGIQAFLHRENSLTSLAMVEVFLQTRCRNIHCQSPLPVDDCDCTVCAQKNGFCSACMCIICSKFDFDADTCRWVGCDFCMHWCHTDCGLRSSCIMPGQSIQGAAGTSEMQFKCIGCGQKSELFGFVKDVFTGFAWQWERDVLTRELECVKRIFKGSEDKRGKQLCEKAEHLISKLESRAETIEVCQSILRFFKDGENDTGNPRDHSRNTAASLLRDGNEKLQDDAQEGMCKSYPSRIDRLMELGKARTSLQPYELDFKDKHPEATELEREKARNRADVEHLESMMRIKQAESQMFQLRADEAHREAEALQRIVLAKCEKIQDEYANKFLKLRLNETEEKRRKKYEEFKICERSACEFNNMKIRVFTDIQELLKKMEATKRQLL